MRPAQLREDFEGLFGYAPRGCFRAPGRVNLIGEHTDYNDGFVLPIAIDRAVHVAIGTRAGRDGGEGGHGRGSAEPTQSAESIRVVSNHRDASGHRLQGQFTAEELVPGSMSGWLSHVAGVVFEIGRSQGVTISGIDLFIDSTVPVGAGLSSSHALEVAVLIAVSEAAGLDVDDREKVFLTQRAENGFVGAPTGIVDQAASIMAQDGHALFLDCRDLAAEQIPFDLPGEGLRLMVIDTRVSHSHSVSSKDDSSVSGDDASSDSSSDSTEASYAARRLSCEQAARALGVSSLREVSDDADLGALSAEQTKRVRHVLSENRRVLSTVEALERGDIRGIGGHLLASHESLAHDYEVSCPELDRAVAAATDAGAIGARMTGGGFGGSAIALVEAERFEAVSAAVTESFAEAGYRTPHIFAVTAGQGAGRLS